MKTESVTSGDLEPGSSLSASGVSSRVRSWLQHLVRSLAHSFAPNSEPRIWFERDRQGYSWWCVSDPVTGHTARFTTTTEVRIWLEERYRGCRYDSPNALTHCSLLDLLRR